MKRLMLTTALSTSVAFGAAAQTADTGAADHSGAAETVPAFLASDFTGKTLYTLTSDDAREIGEGAAEMTPAERDRLRYTSSETFVAGRDDWENVGSIDDIVLTQDGEIRGVLLDVGGFLGFGARTVKVDIDELYFVTDTDVAEDIDDFDVVIAMTEDELENLPEWDEDQLQAGFDVRAYRQGDHQMQDAHAEEASAAGMGEDHQMAEGDQMSEGDQMEHGQREVFTDNYQMLEGDERTADRLIGADVYDAEGENIGNVDDLVIGDDNAIQGILVDVGGFLGMGAHTVMLSIDEAQIGWSDEDGDVRVQVPMTGDALEDMPEHEG
ncbi:PRC-barrel domain-containing protein [Rhodobacteraceae bacterium 2376]|uniref:PRC-barrel domain-containing protein n=1 Tax=Rhabdonatronobacter sediminivivens TaxID=2743469 RepID=A0A7Z0I2D0_9RHOB|nr:PRC-barrel domain-containing protein [Rhabdonatronobacter sediminivivens]NYS26545.1 PRC-barrel domain-containing protein [Rhabdonatronobacter sediminivivens]